MKASSIFQRCRFLSLALATASVFAVSANARTPEIVMRKSQQLDSLILRNAQSMRANQLSNLEADLDRAIQSARRRAGGGGGGGGPLPGGECKLIGRGDANGWAYNFRIQMNGQVMDGVNDLDSALAKLEQYVSDRMCQVAPAETCKLGGRGDYAGWTYNFRAMVGSTPMAGANDSGTILAALTKMQDAGVCRRAQANVACTLLGRGEYAGWTYNYRVAVGSVVMAGSNDYNAIRNFIDSMKNARVCY